MNKLLITALSSALLFSESIASLEHVINEFENSVFHQANQEFTYPNASDQLYIINGQPKLESEEDFDELGGQLYRASYVSYNLKLVHIAILTPDIKNAKLKADQFLEIYKLWHQQLGIKDFKDDYYFPDEPISLAQLNELAEAGRSQKEVLFFTVL